MNDGPLQIVPASPRIRSQRVGELNLSVVVGPRIVSPSLRTRSAVMAGYMAVLHIQLTSVVRLYVFPVAAGFSWTAPEFWLRNVESARATACPLVLTTLYYGFMFLQIPDSCPIMTTS
jgi:hypothetical protein